MGTKQCGCNLEIAYETGEVPAVFLQDVYYIVPRVALPQWTAHFEGGHQRDDKDIERKISPDLSWISKFHKGRIGPINIT